VTWVDVADAALPDETVLDADAAGRRLVVVRAGQRWHALDAWCTHEECPLGDGWVEGGALRCACHGALFDLATGAPLEGPATGPLERFDVRVVAGRIEVDVP
jgi:CDP-4-dehydro-6-deoxyglucose reductase